MEDDLKYLEELGFIKDIWTYKKGSIYLLQADIGVKKFWQVKVYPSGEITLRYILVGLLRQELLSTVKYIRKRLLDNADLILKSVENVDWFLNEID